MKTVNIVLKVVAALAAVAGVVFVIAAYGDKIVAWAKQMIAKCPCHNNDCDIIEFTPADAPEAEAAEEAEAVETVEEVVDQEVAPAAEGEPVADDADFDE